MIVAIERRTEITIREIRKTILHKSMAEMAEFLGISRQAYWCKETGRRNFKSSELLTICKLAEVNPLEVNL